MRELSPSPCKSLFRGGIPSHPISVASGYESRTEEVPNFSAHAFLPEHISFDGGKFYALADISSLFALCE
jgi:hypothetical protein